MKKILGLQAPMELASALDPLLMSFFFLLVVHLSNFGTLGVVAEGTNIRETNSLHELHLQKTLISKFMKRGKKQREKM